MAAGYSHEFVMRMYKAWCEDANDPVRALVWLAIDKKISIVELAGRLEVSRQAIYGWLAQEFQPKPEQLDKIKKQIAVLKKK